MTIKKMCLMIQTTKILPVSTQGKRRRRRKTRMMTAHCTPVSASSSSVGMGQSLYRKSAEELPNTVVLMRSGVNWPWDPGQLN